MSCHAQTRIEQDDLTLFYHLDMTGSASPNQLIGACSLGKPLLPNNGRLGLHE